MSATLKTILTEEKAQLENSRKRFVDLRLTAIRKRNEYETTLMADLIGSLDDALFNINFELETPKEFRRRYRNRKPVSK